MRARWLAAVAVAFVFFACTSQQDDAADSRPVLTFASARMRLIAGSDTLHLLTELAMRPEQRTLGLMERRSLADTAGMLFIYAEDEPDSAGFWMFRTRIPLDIAFMDSTGVIRAIRQMVPCPTDLAEACPSYLPGVRYRAALEVNAGYFARHTLAVGDKLVLGDTSQHVNNSSRP